MSNIQNIVLSDATPSDHTFVPIQANPSLSVWSESAANDRPYLRPTVSFTFREAKSQEQVTKVTRRLNVPLFDTVEGVIVPRGTARVVTEYVLPSDMTSTEKSNLLAMSRDLDGEALTESYVVDGDPAF